MNGQNGASSRATVSRQLRSVAKAAGSPSQKRRRERRTYQLERSSTRSAIARPARVVSKASRRSATTCAVPVDRDSAQRSSASLGATDRKSTRLNSSHLVISYAVFCLKKKN